MSNKRIFEAKDPSGKSHSITASGKKDWNFFGFVEVNRTPYAEVANYEWVFQVAGETENNVARNLKQQGYTEYYKTAIVQSTQI